jgi:chromatin remodeling complex protein RSC6
MPTTKVRKSSKKTKKSRSTKSKTTKVEVPKVPEVPEVPEVPVEKSKTRTRRVVNQESVQKEFAALVQELTDEVAKIKQENSTSTKRGKTGVRFLKHICTRLKTLAKDTNRVLSKKRPSTRTNTNSGFMKPVEISSEMRKFTGWDEEPKSRVQVTKFICDYIKKNDLQNPADRRQIRPNSQLKKILKLKGEQKNPLTYYTLQKHIQHHFV